MNKVKLIVQETYGDTKLNFSYDANGNPYTFSYTKGNNSPSVYHYVLNLQGDVVRIVTNKGVTRVTYEYDAWGNITNMTYTNKTLADANPLRYRGYYYDQETGLYYLQSRYYNPQWGRFINADNIVAGIGGSVHGNNMFAYCFNNPINMVDETGNWPTFKDAVKWVAKNVVRPVVKEVQNVLSEIDLTYSTGINVSGTPSAWIFNGQLSLSVDTKGNVAIQASGGGGVTGGDASASITGYHSITNAPTIDKLNGAYYQVGGSIAAPIEGVLVAAGGDLMFMPDPAMNTGYFGLTGNLGFGTPGAEFHAEWGTTDTLPSTRFNVFDVARSVYIRIMEW